MIDYNEVDSANRMLDQETDGFRLDDIDADDKEEAEEKAQRVKEYSRVGFFLMSNGIHLHESAGISARIMDHWTTEEVVYYKDKEGNESLFYRDFEITKRDTQWMFEYQENQTYDFWDADLMLGLKDIDVLIEKGGLK